jgi:hypothetical protein
VLRGYMPSPCCWPAAARRRACLNQLDVEPQAATEPMSLRDVRRAVRRLPRDRRKDMISAIRAGRAVSDPRDAALAVAWAEPLERFHWPGWVLPRSRPRGKRALLWLAHLAWIVAAVAVALASLWSGIPGVWRWVIVGFLAYSAIVTPLMITQTLRAYWNASDAAEENRRLVAVADDHPTNRF